MNLSPLSAVYIISGSTRSLLLQSTCEYIIPVVTSCFRAIEKVYQVNSSTTGSSSEVLPLYIRARCTIYVSHSTYCCRHIDTPNKIHVTAVVFTLNRSFYPATSAVPPVFFLILHPRETQIMWSQTETEKPNAKESR